MPSSPFTRCRRRGFATAISHRSYLPTSVVWSTDTTRPTQCACTCTAWRTGRTAIGLTCITLVMRLSGVSLTNICRTAPAPVQRCRHQVRAALRQLLVTLVDAGGLISSDQPDAIEDQLQRFDSHMVHARGLTETTRIRRLGVVRALQRLRAADDPDVIATPSADDLRRFITQELSRISPASASSLAGALRA